LARLSVLVSRSGYHNKESAVMMHAVGLIPSDTAAPGGREVAQKVSHYIETGRQFERACAVLVKRGFDQLYVKLWTDGGERARKKKAASKTRYTCPDCRANAWPKPDLPLVVASGWRPRKPRRRRNAGKAKTGRFGLRSGNPSLWEPR
jgi:hypothetical protein